MQDIIEHFNRTYRTKILDFYLLRTLNDVRKTTEYWLYEYNSERPRESLNNLTLEEYRLMAENPQISKKMCGTKKGVLTQWLRRWQQIASHVRQKGIQMVSVDKTPPRGG